MMDKPLMEYTLAEVRSMCTMQENCSAQRDGTVCPFWDDSLRCRLKNDLPSLWVLRFLTAPEQELLKLTGAKFISRDMGLMAHSEEVALWRDKPMRYPPADGIVWMNSTKASLVGRLVSELFPSIPPGVCWEVAKLLDEKPSDK